MPPSDPRLDPGFEPPAPEGAPHASPRRQPARGSPRSRAAGGPRCSAGCSGCCSRWWRWASSAAPSPPSASIGTSPPTCRTTAGWPTTSPRRCRASTPPTAGCWPSLPPSAASSCRSRPSPSASRPPSSAPRTSASGSTTASTRSASSAPSSPISSSTARPAHGRRLDHHPAGRQEHAGRRRPHHAAQGARGDPGDPHRGGAAEGAHPRAVPERDLPGLPGLWRRRRRPGLFQQGLDELTVGEIGFLGALPKAPNNYNPLRYPEAARARRDWVLDRMAEDGAITAAEATTAKAEPIVPRLLRRPEVVQVGQHFTEEVRRELINRFGPEQTTMGGLVVRTSIEPPLQAATEQALRGGLLSYDRRRGGWRGPVARVSAGAADWMPQLEAVARPGGVLPEWRLAVALEVRDREAKLGWVERADARAPSQPRTASLAWMASPGAARRCRRTASPRCGGCRTCSRWATWCRSRCCPPRPAGRNAWRCARSRRSRGRSSPSTRPMAGCWPWPAAGPSIKASSIARPRRSASPAPRSSRSSICRRWKPACRRTSASSTGRSR